MATISEPNTILELNSASTSSYILLIPRLPSAVFLGSAFNAFNSPTTTTPPATSTDSDCETDQSSTIRREHNLDLTNFKLFVSDIVLPGVTIDVNKVSTQMATLSRASKMSFSDLSTTIRVSENWLNYQIVLFWMYAIFNPAEFNKISGREMVNNFFTDIYIILINDHREKVAEFKLLDCFPTSLPAIPLSVKTSDIVTMDITWSHSGFFCTNNYILKYV